MAAAEHSNGGGSVRNGRELLPVAGWIAVWVPAMAGASYAWRHGEYYDYGWFVPPVAVWLLLRRWHSREANPGRRGPERGWLTGVLLLCPWILVLRTLSHADPGWRLPVALLGLTAALAGHWIFYRVRGLRFSLSFWKITLFLVAALPWPSRIESGIVHGLTGQVVDFAAELFRLAGKPVEVFGEQMRLHGAVVEVTDGCSGVRSFQSFLMATWFFAELQRLSVARSLQLLVWALVVAFAVNVARTCALAHIRFAHGEDAFARAHDSLGVAAFVVSALAFLWISGKIGAAGRRAVRRRVAAPAAGQPPQPTATTDL